MNPTLDWLKGAEKHIRQVLEKVRPQLLEAQGTIGHRLKDDKTAVTEMDTLVEERLRAALHTYDASVGFSGEETGVDYGQKTFWLADPIDGTEPFIRGLSFATNMIALIDNGQPIMGIIYNFSLGDYYLAIKGHGATCNGHAIRVSDRSIDRAFVSVGSVRTEYQEGFGLGDQLRKELGVPAIPKFCATGSELMAVATGAIEARLTYKGHAKPWDYAPGAIIVQEAGGRIANIGSDSYDYRNTDVIAANPAVFGEIMHFMNEFARSRQ